MLLLSTINLRSSKLLKERFITICLTVNRLLTLASYPRITNKYDSKFIVSIPAVCNEIAFSALDNDKIFPYKMRDLLANVH